MAKRIKTSLILFLLLFALLLFEPVLVRHIRPLWNLMIYLAIFVITVWVFIKIIVELVRILKNIKFFRLIDYVPFIILVCTLTGALLLPFDSLFKFYQSPIVFRACREGTQNQQTFYLKANSEFEIRSTSIIYINYFMGKYRRKQDTIFLKYSGERFKILSDTLIVRNNLIYNAHKDTLEPTYFYLGYCKGLN